MIVRTSLALVIALVLVSRAAAEPAPPAVRAEIAALFAKLQASGCRFQRNGSWYSGSEAQAHLTRKLEYLEGKGMVKSTEDFINLAAASSSSSGQPYLVKCADNQPVQSRSWLSQQLQIIRASR